MFLASTVLAFFILSFLTFVNCDSEISLIGNDCQDVLCWPKCCKEEEIYFVEIANCAKWKNINNDEDKRSFSRNIFLN